MPVFAVLFSFNACFVWEKKKDTSNSRKDILDVCTDYGFTLGARTNSYIQGLNLAAQNTRVGEGYLYGAYYIRQLNTFLDFTSQAVLTAMKGSGDGYQTGFVAQSGFRWQLLRTPKNHLGILVNPGIQYRKFALKNRSRLRIQVDVNGRLYIFPAISLYVGILQSIGDFDFLESQTDSSLFHTNYPYLAFCYHLFPQMAAVVEWFSGDWISALSSSHIELGYNWTQDKWHLNLLKLEF